MRQFEESLFYLPFLIIAVLFNLYISFTCNQCGRKLVFDWTATRLGSCRKCAKNNSNVMVGYWAHDSSSADPNGFLHTKIMSKISLNSGFLLDAGCGNGILLQKIASTDFVSIGVEIDKLSLLHAHKNKKNKDIHYICGSVLHLPLKANIFEQVLSTEVMEHVKKPCTYLKEMLRVSKLGGLLLLTVPNGRGSWGTAPGHVNFFSRKYLFRLLKFCGFREFNVHAFGLEYPIITYFSRSLTMFFKMSLPYAFPLPIEVRDCVSTNFIIEGKKSGTSEIKQEIKNGY